MLTEYIDAAMGHAHYDMRYYRTKKGISARLKGFKVRGPMPTHWRLAGRN